MKDVIVVGTGAGGATVGNELTKKGMKVTFIERGPFDTAGNAYKHYDNCDVGVELLKTSCVGGTTMVTAGNAVRTCQSQFKNIGIDLETEFQEIEAETCVSTLPDSHFGDGTKLIMETAQELGFNTQKMPKFINPQSCKPCGKCAFGCPRDAKWTSKEYVNEALNQGAKLVTDTNVTELIIKDNEIKGVKTNKKEYNADTVVLAAGGIGTPKIMRKNSIEAGNHLFVDSFVTVGGLLKNINFDKEVTMNALVTLDDVILSPHYSEILANNLKTFNATNKDILSMMVKIPDEPSGKVREDYIEKFSTAKDVGLLSKGASAAGAILTEAGVDPKTLTSTIARGAHPGGTAAIGEVVDKNLETEVSGLFVSDASVFPWAPGAPPVLTIVALAKRLGNYIGSTV